VYEGMDDLEGLQALLDRSHASAGSHHAEVHAPRVRLTAVELCERLPGMQVFVVATVSSDGRPFTGPVDTFLFRGRLWFGTSPRALRARHLSRNAAVSATLVHGETLVVTVHGHAAPVDLQTGHGLALAGHLTSHYGDAWAREFLPASYFVIEPQRLFAADMARHHVT